MRTLSVSLPHHSYPILWENDLQKLEQVIKEKTKSGKHFVITNETIFSIYENIIKKLFGDSQVLIIDDGEEYKNSVIITNLADQMLEFGANRKSTLWAFGGGVVGDITGFLASIYMRGIHFYQIPTTLLAMVDSSVGGKTGVNLKHGKNMIGTFYQPDGVFIHVNFLKSLNTREFRSGLSEVIKSALLADAGLFKLIEDQISEIFPKNGEINGELMEEISFRSVQIKANVVMQDEKETGIRAILNLGHTMAHALESFYGYSHIKHGEAVSIGITYAAMLSVNRGLLKSNDLKRIQSLFDNLHMYWKREHLPVIARTTTEIASHLPQPDELIELMKGDKKNIDEAIRFILIKGIGEYTLPQPVDIPTIKKTLEEFICL